MRYRKKPIVIEAMQVPDASYKNFVEGRLLMDWLDQNNCHYAIHPDAVIYINTLEGEMKAVAGDWIIKGVKGEFYPCKNDIFEMTYEAV